MLNLKDYTPKRKYTNYGNSKTVAEEADELKEHFAAESMYQYGMILLDGLHGVPRDPITGKYWIDKAAGMGFEPAINEQNKRWK